MNSRQGGLSRQRGVWARIVFLGYSAGTWNTCHRRFYCRKARFTKPDSLLAIAKRSALLLALLGVDARFSTLHATGGPGYAVHVGAGSYVQINSDAALDAYPLTVTAWFRTTSTVSFKGAMIAKSQNSSSAYGWQVFLSSSSIHAAFVNPNGSAGSVASPLNSAGPVLADGAWHHLAFTVDAGGGKLYVDGALNDSKAWTGTPGATTSTDPIRLGLYADGTGAFTGDLDEVTVWNVALSQSQIQTNRNRSLTGSEAGLIAYYRCDENAPGNLEDSAPLDGDNFGAINGATFVVSGIAPFTAWAQTLAPTLTPPSVTLNGQVNPGGTNTSAWFEWGATDNSGNGTNYGSTTAVQAIPAGTVNQAISQVLHPLTNGNYHYRAMGSNTFGLGTGADQSFVFSGTPLVTTLPATLVQSSSARLNGGFNDNGSLTYVWFQWGTTTNYGNLMPMDNYGSCTCTQTVTRVLSGLTGGVLYHYQVLASNSFGLGKGGDQSFWLPVTQPVLFSGGLVSGTNLWLTGTCPQVGNYLVLSSTNATLPLSQWTPLVTSYVAVSNLNNFQTMLINVFHTGPTRQFFALCGPTNFTGFTNGEFCTYNQVSWDIGGTMDSLGPGILENNYFSVYPTGVVEVGIPGTGGFSMQFSEYSYVFDYFVQVGPPGLLVADLVDPTSSSSGSFGGDVLALQLDVDFSAAGFLNHDTGVPFGTLKLCNFTTNGDAIFPVTQAQANALNGQTVAQVLAEANIVLGGGSGTYGLTIDLLDGLVLTLGTSFPGGSVAPFAQAHLQRPFHAGEFVSYNQADWALDPSQLLSSEFLTVYPAGGFTVGSPTGFSATFSFAAAIEAYLPASGIPAPLDSNLLNPSSTSSGMFGGEVLALRLNVDFSAAGVTGSGGKFGDLRLCNLRTYDPNVAFLTGKPVAEFLAEAEIALGGGTAQGLDLGSWDVIVSNLNAAFEGGQPSIFAQQNLLRP